MPDRQQSIPPTLDRYSEAIRRQLYDLIEASEFTPHADESTDRPQPLYSAEDAQLSVFYLAGRWFAQWNRLEVPSFQPEAQRIEFLRVKLSDESPDGWMLHEA